MRGSVGPAIAVCLLIVLSIVPLYALSIFPAVQLVYEDRLSCKTFETIYAPVLWLSNRYSPLQDLLVAGENWWLGKKPIPPERPPDFSS